MGRHSRGRSPGDLGRAAAGGDAMSRVLALGLSGAGTILPRRNLFSVKDLGAVAGSEGRRGISLPTSGVSGGGDEGDGEECVAGIVVSATLHTRYKDSSADTTLWGVRSVVMFCKVFLTCSVGHWADTAAIVQPN